MCYYVDLITKKVYVCSNSHRVFFDCFDSAKELQEVLCKIKYFVCYKNPKKYVSVIKKFEKETGLEVIY